VWLIVYYVIFMIAGDLAAYAIGLVTELEFGGQVSLIVFLVLYFLFLWVAWVLAYLTGAIAGTKSPLRRTRRRKEIRRRVGSGALGYVRTEGPRRALTNAGKAKGKVRAAGRAVLDADGRSMGIGDALDD